MVSSTTIITIPLAVLALFMANIVVSNGQSKIEAEVEIAILRDNATFYGDNVFINIRDYCKAVITEFNEHFSLDQTKVRLAIIDYDHDRSSVRLNLTTPLSPAVNHYDENTFRSGGQPIALHKALQNAKDKIFNQSRPGAMKVVFAILVKVNGTDEKANVAAKELRAQGVRIYIVVFCEKDDNINHLYAIANDTDVYKHYWGDAARETVRTFADKAVRWLKARIIANIPTRPPTTRPPPPPTPAPGPGPPPGPVPPPVPPPVDPPKPITDGFDSWILFVATIGPAFIIIGIGIGLYCCRGKKNDGSKTKTVRGKIIHPAGANDPAVRKKELDEKKSFRPESLVMPATLDRDKSTANLGDSRKPSTMEPRRNRSVVRDKPTRSSYNPRDRPVAHSAMLDRNQSIPDAGHGPRHDPRLGHPRVPEKSRWRTGRR